MGKKICTLHTHTHTHIYINNLNICFSYTYINPKHYWRFSTLYPITKGNTPSTQFLLYYGFRIEPKVKTSIAITINYINVHTHIYTLPPVLQSLTIEICYICFSLGRLNPHFGPIYRNHSKSHIMDLKYYKCATIASVMSVSLLLSNIWSPNAGSLISPHADRRYIAIAISQHS